MDDLSDDSDSEGEQAAAQKTQNKLLGPVSRIDLREKIEVLVNEISEASRRYEHE
jgi:hypothetical protein